MNFLGNNCFASEIRLHFDIDMNDSDSRPTSSSVYHFRLTADTKLSVGPGTISRSNLQIINCTTNCYLQLFNHYNGNIVSLQSLIYHIRNAKLSMVNNLYADDY